MFLKSRFLRSTLGLCSFLTILMVLVSGLAVSNSSATAPTTMLTPGETIETFVRNAYSGVGRFATCTAVSDENATLEGLLPTNTPGFEAEARRFVSTLIETQASYNTPPPFFAETPQYSTRNPVYSGNTTGFVTDLYHAFLQRDPDSGGLNFWVGNLNSYGDAAVGRRLVLDAFGTIPDDAEFSSLVHSLVDGGTVDCGPPGGGGPCDPGQTPHPKLCE